MLECGYAADQLTAWAAPAPRPPEVIAWRWSCTISIKADGRATANRTPPQAPKTVKVIKFKNSERNQGKNIKLKTANDDKTKANQHKTNNNRKMSI